MTTPTINVSGDGGSFAGEPFQVVATVSGDAPTGTVTLFDKTNAIDTVVMLNGVATFPVSGLGVGTHTIWAKYNGDANNTPIASASFLHMVYNTAASDGELSRRQAVVTTFEQADPSDTWLVTHSANGYPTIDVYVMFQGEMNKIIPQSIEYIDRQTVRVRFSRPYSGFATTV